MLIEACTIMSRLYNQTLWRHPRRTGTAFLGGKASNDSLTKDELAKMKKKKVFLAFVSLLPQVFLIVSEHSEVRLQRLSHEAVCSLLTLIVP